MLLEDALGAAADPQIDIADDAGDAARLAVFARRAHRRDAVDEFGLAERFQLLRTVGAVHLAAFLEAGRGDVVAAADIGQQILKQIAVARPVPHMMVGIDDRQLGLDDLFLPPVEPVRADRRMAAGRDRGLGHGGSPPEVALGLRQLCPSPPRNSTALSAGGGSTLKIRRNFPDFGVRAAAGSSSNHPRSPTRSAPAKPECVGFFAAW